MIQVPHQSPVHVEKFGSYVDFFVRKIRSWKKSKPYRYFVIIVLVTLMGDVWTLIRYRRFGLFKYKRIFVDPKDVTLGFKSHWPKFHVGVVSSAWETLELVEVREAAGGTVRRCIRRLEPGQTWESVGELEAQLLGKQTVEQISKVRATFRSQTVTLNRLIQDVHDSGGIMSRRELGFPWFREWLGISVILTAEGKFVLHDGHHRFGIALGMNLNRIPVAVVSLHPRFAGSKELASFMRRHA